MSVDISPLPGLITATSVPVGVETLKLRVAEGYGWISYQAVDHGKATGIEIGGGKAAGFQSTGVWGVVYDQPAFHEFGVLLGREAIRLGAEHVIVDAEQCAKDTRATRGMLPVIVGLRDGGWLGPVHLSTLGAPVNGKPHGPNDFAIDVDSFLMTGGGVQAQAYVNAYDEYDPVLCMDYWLAVGVPKERINLTIDLAPEPGSANYPDDLTGAGWATLLTEAGAGRAFSVFMVEFGTLDDWAGLAPIAAAPPPPTPVPTPEDDVEPVTDQQGRDAVVFAVQAAAQNWPQDKPKARLTVARRICQAATDDPKWNACRDTIVKALDDAGVPS
jgi:hypothetical protein